MSPGPAAGKPVASETTLRVRYAETDQMGVVYYSNYFIWFEVGRVELLRQAGFSYRDLEQDHYGLPVVEARCRYKIPTLYDDVIVVRSRVSRLRPSMIKFGYEYRSPKRRRSAGRRGNRSLRDRTG